MYSKNSHCDWKKKMKNKKKKSVRMKWNSQSSCRVFIFLQSRSFKDLFNATRMLGVEFQILRRVRSPGCVRLRSVLIDQMRVLGPSTASKVLDLHHFRQHSLVEMILQSGHSEIALVHLVFVILKHTKIEIMMNINSINQ